MAQATAILSVYDKTGLVELAKGLAAKNVRLLGSGGTARMVREAGLEIRCVDDAGDDSHQRRVRHYPGA